MMKDGMQSVKSIGKRVGIKSGVLILIVALLSSSMVFGVENGYGSGGGLSDKTLTIEEMLTYAIQDEYLAKAEYNKIMKTYGSIKPFTNISKTEERHISLLLPLFKTYKVAIPKDTSASYVVTPKTLVDSYKAGVIAEKNNIAMYTKFLKEKLPSDVRDVFLELKKASENHLKAFSRKS